MRFGHLAAHGRSQVNVCVGVAESLGRREVMDEEGFSILEAFNLS